MKKEVTLQKLIGELLNLNNKSTFAHITYITDENKSKTKNRKKLLQKEVSCNISINFEYDKKIQRLLYKQHLNIKFVGVANWHTPLIEGNRTILTDKKTRSKLYLRYAIEHHTKFITQLYYKGKKITKKEAENLDLFTPSYYDTPDTVGRGLVCENNNFHFRVLDLTKLKEIKINGITYVNKDFKDVRY